MERFFFQISEATKRFLKDPTKIKYLSPDEAQFAAQSSSEGAKKDYYDGVFGTIMRESECKEYVKRKNVNKNIDYTVVFHQKGIDRRPMNKYDLNIFKINENKLLSFDGESIRLQVNRKKIDVNSVPGAFLVSNVLSPSECEDIIRMAESSPHGYVPDEPITSAKPPEGFAPRASNLVILSEKLTRIMYERTMDYLPQSLGAKGENKLVGLNARLRLYRYQPGAIYRPHVDGSWPGSGMHGNEYHYDYFGDRWSRLTFLVYLNDDFEGGGTTFYVPSKDVGNIEAFTVEPRQGSVLVFPHGGVAGSLVHEGSFCKVGVKYIIRSDVLYSVPGHSRFQHGNDVVS